MFGSTYVNLFNKLKKILNLNNELIIEKYNVSMANIKLFADPFYLENFSNKEESDEFFQVEYQEVRKGPRLFAYPV